MGKFEYLSNLKKNLRFHMLTLRKKLNNLLFD